MSTGTTFGLVRYQDPAASFRHLQRFEYAGFGSGCGLSLGKSRNGRILGALDISSQQYKIGLLFYFRQK